MSVAIRTSELNQNMIDRINTELPIKLENTKYNKLAPPKYVYPYSQQDEFTILPFSYASRVLKIPRPIRTNFSQISLDFEATLREEQLIVRNEAASIISKKGSVIISAYCGFGKTFCSINLAIAIGFKTLIVVHTVPLMGQWEREIIKVCPSARIRQVTSKSEYKEADFYIINAQNAVKKGKDFFSDIGLVIVDEAHKIMAATLSKALQYVQPRYLLGLTATPYRPDGLNILLDRYFGTHDKIVRKLWCPHKVYKIQTGIVPTIEKTAMGTLNWNSVLDSLCYNDKRNDMIIKVIMAHPKSTFMVLTKRLLQGEYLMKHLAELGISVTSMMGKNKEYDVDARVLIGTAGKIGTGFDHPALDTLILASDVQEYFIQFLGRVMRRKNSNPIIFDFVDNYSILDTHYETRKKVYIEHGGKIMNFDMSLLY